MFICERRAGRGKVRENKMKVKQTNQMFVCYVGSIEILTPCVNVKQGRGESVAAKATDGET